MSFYNKVKAIDSVITKENVKIKESQSIGKMSR